MREPGVTPHVDWHYLRKGKRRVDGWLQRVDAEIIGAILSHQAAEGIAGSVAEIGVHHGKSFIPLARSLRPGEMALAIDVFEAQAINLDGSGRGSRDHFDENLRKFGIDQDNVCVFSRSSEDVTPREISDAVGPVRYFSVDGGHWASIVESDLALAEQSLAPGGVIALDDYCRVDWPDVTAGYHFWQQQTHSSIVPFAAGSNKLFLCHAGDADHYRAALGTEFLRRFRTGSYSGYAGVIDCYRIEPWQQDETGIRAAFSVALALFWPGLFARLARPARREAEREPAGADTLER